MPFMLLLMNLCFYKRFFLNRWYYMRNRLYIISSDTPHQTFPFLTPANPIRQLFWWFFRPKIHHVWNSVYIIRLCNQCVLIHTSQYHTKVSYSVPIFFLIKNKNIFTRLHVYFSSLDSTTWILLTVLTNWLMTERALQCTLINDRRLRCYVMGTDPILSACGSSRGSAHSWSQNTALGIRKCHWHPL